jgi:hypothetical protein
MGWPFTLARFTLIFLFLSACFVPTMGVFAQTDEEHAGRLHTVTVAPDSPFEQNIVLEEGQRALVAWECNACNVDASGEGTSTTAGALSTMTIAASSTTEANISLASATSETVHLMVVAPIDEAYPTVRPAPGEAVVSTQIGSCDAIEACIAPERGTLATQISPADDPTFLLSGHLGAQNGEYIVMEVKAGETLEWQWLATTQSLSVRMYHQTNTSETIMGTPHETYAGFSALAGEAPRTSWWTAEEDGRFIARLSSPEQGASWAAHVFLHPAAESLNLVEVDLINGTKVVGHHGQEALFAWSEVHTLHLSTPLANATVQVDQLMNGVWVTGEPTFLQADTTLTMHPYPNTTVGRLSIINTTVFALDLRLESFADLNGLEAPAYRPSSLEADNTSWPNINLTTITNAEFTLAVHDTADTYRFEVDGWLDSIHFVQFTLDGNVEGLEAQLWDMDQTTGEVLATDITRPVGDSLSIGLQVGRGTHYLQLRFQNASQATPHLWGEDVSERPYAVQAAYSLIDEGEEPWYPPSEDAVFWGGVARWFLGLLFLLPVAYLGVWLRRNQRFARLLAEQKQRLAWYTARLDSGETSVKEARSDLSNVLEAVAQLEWREGMDAWGEVRVEHRTESVALAVWQVDPRLAKTEGNWVMVVGVHILSDAWELAALRFDAPEGQAFEITHVEPRFLHQGEELFLDQLHEGHRAYVVVELQGTAKHVDVELNGRVGGEPFAARMPETVHRPHQAS